MGCGVSCVSIWLLSWSHTTVLLRFRPTNRLIHAAWDTEQYWYTITLKSVHLLRWDNVGNWATPVERMTLDRKGNQMTMTWSIFCLEIISGLKLIGICWGRPEVSLYGFSIEICVENWRTLVTTFHQENPNQTQGIRILRRIYIPENFYLQWLLFHLICFTLLL